MTTTYRFLGNTDEVDTCDCCGRTDLKSTVALEDEAGNVVHFGVVCAALATRTTAKDVRSAARKADEEKRAREAAARQAEFRAEYDRFQAFLDSRVAPKGQRFLQLQALGGMAAARAAFAAEVA